MRHGLHPTCIAAVAVLLGQQGVCSPGDDEPQSPPVLEIITPQVGGAPNGLAAVLVRTDRKARVAILDGESTVGAGLSDRSVSAVIFKVPDRTTSSAPLTLTAAAVGGPEQETRREFQLTGIPGFETGTVAEQVFDVATLGEEEAVLRGEGSLWLTKRSTGGSVGTPSGRTWTALASDHARSGVMVAGNGPTVAFFHVEEGVLVNSESVELARYHGGTEITKINALHANRELIAAATAEGMAILDRSVVDQDSGTYCRQESAEAALLGEAPEGSTMTAVVVMPNETVVAGGAFLNVYEAGNDDERTCTPPMPGRQNRAVFVPGSRNGTWEVTSIALTDHFLWIGTAQSGIFRVAVDAALTATNDFPPNQVLAIAEESLPLTTVVDLAPGTADTVWVLLRTGSIEGLAWMNAEGRVLVWIDGSATKDEVRAVDTSPDRSLIWLATRRGYTLFGPPSQN